MKNIRLALSLIGLTAMAFGTINVAPTFADSEAQFGGASEAGGSVSASSEGMHYGESKGSHTSTQEAQTLNSSTASKENSSDATTEVGGRPVFHPSITSLRGGAVPPQLDNRVMSTITPTTNAKARSRSAVAGNANRSSSSGAATTKKVVAQHVPTQRLTSYHWTKRHSQIAANNRTYMVRTIQEAARTR